MGRHRGQPAAAAAAAARGKPAARGDARARERRDDVHQPEDVLVERRQRAQDLPAGERAAEAHKRHRHHARRRDRGLLPVLRRRQLAAARAARAQGAAQFARRQHDLDAQ
eukprot:6838794-Prymnesium_polylepis.1